MLMVPTIVLLSKLITPMPSNASPGEGVTPLRLIYIAIPHEPESVGVENTALEVDVKVDKLALTTAKYVSCYLG